MSLDTFLHIISVGSIILILFDSYQTDKKLSAAEAKIISLKWDIHHLQCKLERMK